MAENSLYRCTPRQAKRYILECLEAGLVPVLESSPGMGKSSIMREIAQELGLFLIDHRLSTSAPEDLSGLPRFRADGTAEFAPFADLFPLRGAVIPKGYNGWLLFLDEWNAASRAVQAACFKLILDRMTGQKHLHELCLMSAAGNLSTDRSITNPISTAMQSRVVHLEMEINFDEWLFDVAIPQNYDKRIIAYLSQYPSKLMDFRPDHNEKTFNCPRTWEFMDRLIKGKEVTEDRAAMYAGTITSGSAVDFIQFTKVFHNMVSIKDILANPKTCHVPQDNSTRWAVITHMMEKMTADNWGALMDYSSRFSSDHRILFFRASLNRMPALRQHPAFIQHAPELGRYLLS
jgi:hypothetical protein